MFKYFLSFFLLLSLYIYGSYVKPEKDLRAPSSLPESHQNQYQSLDQKLQHNPDQNQTKNQNPNQNSNLKQKKYN